MSKTCNSVKVTQFIPMKGRFETFETCWMCWVSRKCSTITEELSPVSNIKGPGFLMRLARSDLTFPTEWRRPLQIAHPASASPWPHQLLQYYCYNQKSPRPTSRWWVQPFGLSSHLKISWKSGRSANSTSLVAPFIISKVFIGPRCPWGPI